MEDHMAKSLTGIEQRVMTTLEQHGAEAAQQRVAGLLALLEQDKATGAVDETQYRDVKAELERIAAKVGE
jgi:uncharacterized membrane protein YdfJ with MMPL/SSD domain